MKQNETKCNKGEGKGREGSDVTFDGVVCACESVFCVCSALAFLAGISSSFVLVKKVSEEEKRGKGKKGEERGGK